MTLKYIFDATHPELAHPKRHLRLGERSMTARRVQEWLCLHEYGVEIDGHYGPITAAALDIYLGGRPPGDWWENLTWPLHKAMLREVIRHGSFGDDADSIAHWHASHYPREVGGQNRGPWVRTYTGGPEGPEYPWCAGFVSFVIAQTAFLRGEEPPIVGSLSCDVLAQQAQRAGLFVRGEEVEEEDLCEGAVFLVRGRREGDWTHTGFCLEANGLLLTVEGNTNDSGSRDGYEVCERRRSMAGKDFILLEARP